LELARGAINTKAIHKPLNFFNITLLVKVNA